MPIQPQNAAGAASRGPVIATYTLKRKVAAGANQRRQLTKAQARWEVTDHGQALGLTVSGDTKLCFPDGRVEGLSGLEAESDAAWAPLVLFGEQHDAVAGVGGTVLRLAAQERLELRLSVLEDPRCLTCWMTGTAIAAGRTVTLRALDV